MKIRTFKTKNRYVKGFLTLSNAPNHKRKRVRRKINTAISPIKETKCTIKISFNLINFIIFFILFVLLNMIK